MTARPYSEFQLGIDWDRATERAAEWSERAEELIEAWCQPGYLFSSAWYRGPFSIFDVEKVVGPPPGSGNAAGALFGRLSRQGKIVACGRVRSPRPEAHRRTVTLWRAA